MYVFVLVAEGSGWGMTALPDIWKIAKASVCVFERVRLYV
jgi:hypothetical protein